MHVFYTPDIQKSNELPEEEAQHCISQGTTAKIERND